MDKLNLFLNDTEVMCLQLAMFQASQATFTDPYTRKAMQELLDHVTYAISCQVPEYNLTLEYGDF